MLTNLCVFNIMLITSDKLVKNIILDINKKLISEYVEEDYNDKKC